MWTGAGLGAGKMLGKNLSESGALEAAFRGSPWAGVAGGGAGGTAHLVVWFPSSGEQKRLPSCGEQDEAQEASPHVPSALQHYELCCPVRSRGASSLAGLLSPFSTTSGPTKLVLFCTGKEEL